MDNIGPPNFSIPEDLKRVLESLRDLASRANKASRTLSDGLTEIFANLERLPHDLPDPFVVLGREGWYPDAESTYADLCEVSRLIDTGGREKGRLWLVGYYQANLDRIEARLTQEHPHRSAPLGQSFAAHRRGDYFLSVPAFLIQADGICQELTDGLQAYSQKQTQGIGPHFSKLAEQGQDALMMKPLLDGTLPLTLNARNRALDFEGLNRHAVIHGTDLTYGTEENSLKALSFLSFLASLLPIWKADLSVRDQLDNASDEAN